MKKVLVDPRRGTFHDIVAEGATFRIAPPLLWVDAPDDVKPDWSYTLGVGFSPPPVASEEPDLEALRAKAERDLLAELLDTRGQDADAPKSIKDYAAAKGQGRGQ